MRRLRLGGGASSSLPVYVIKLLMRGQDQISRTRPIPGPVSHTVKGLTGCKSLCGWNVLTVNERAHHVKFLQVCLTLLHLFNRFILLFELLESIFAIKVE